MIYEHVLHGCAPIPLAGYLKALGIFRLVGEQKDGQAYGFWRDERFILQTKLTQDELVHFFAKEYQPSPIISPWNGRAGFLEGEGDETDEESSRAGAELIRHYRRAGDRFQKLSAAVNAYSSMEDLKELDKMRAEAKPLKERKRKRDSLTEQEKDHLSELEALVKRRKQAVITNLRSEAPDGAIAWFDACQRITNEAVVFPLLGAGGVDGSRDFGVNFGLALGQLFDFKCGDPLGNTWALIRESLGFDIVPGLKKSNLGQFEPGGAGENTTSGFIGELPSNPADFLLVLEGAVLFSGASTRRLGSSQTRMSFPFTVASLTAGSGATSGSDDQNFAEFWAPIWNRPVRLDELAAFLSEGRTNVGERTAKDGLEFAVAVSTLGSQRGVSEFQRFALLQREPRNPKKATPLGRVRVRHNPRASLVSELDARGWLSRARDVTRHSARNGQIDRSKEAPDGLRKIGRRLDEALFRLAGDGSPDAVQETLMAMGALMLEIRRRPNLRQSEKGPPPVPPPARLSEEWTSAADDGSHEFALAAAAASLDATTEDWEFRLPFRRHLVPLGWQNGREAWKDDTEAEVVAVWTGRNLVRDLAAVLERRLIEAQHRTFVHRASPELATEPELPLHGRRTAPLASVAAFLSGRTDDERIAALTAGLSWARSHGLAIPVAGREDALPQSYASLRPLFNPAGIGLDPERRRILDPLPLVRLLRAGRPDQAILLAQRFARGAGLSSPFAALRAAVAIDAPRLAAALLFPIAASAQERLVDRAYPDLNKAEDEIDAA